MFKKLLRAVQIFKTGKVIKDSLNDVKQYEEKQKEEANKLGINLFTPSEFLDHKRGKLDKGEENRAKYEVKDTFAQDQKDTNTFAITLLESRIKSDEDLTNSSNHRFAKSIENTPEILEAAIKEAHRAATISGCKKAKVGAVIFNDGEILASGFNTNLSNVICDSVECQVKGKNGSTNCGIAHAEAEALRHLRKGESYGDQKYIYCTHFPCTACMLQVTAEHIWTIYYSKENYFTDDLTRMYPYVEFIKV